MPIVIEQLNSQTHWGSIDGVTTTWNFSFSGGYILPEHVRAYYIDAAGDRQDIIIDPETMLIGEFQLELIPELPADTQRLVIYRDTPKDLPLVNFEEGSRVTERNLDRIAQQAVFIAAEILDAITAEGMGVSGVSLTDILARVTALEAGGGGAAWADLTGDPEDSSALVDYVAAELTDLAGSIATALALKAPLASPSLTGIPSAPTAAPGTNSTQIATTAFVEAAVAAGGGGGGGSGGAGGALYLSRNFI
jgi:hypothetical protein